MKKYLLKHPFLMLLVIILGFITQNGLSITALYTMTVIDTITYGSPSDLLTSAYIGVLIVLGVFLSLLLYIRIMQKYFLKTMIYFKKDVFKSIMEIEISEFSKDNSSKYISLMNNDIDTIQSNYINAILALTKDISSFLISFIIMLFISPINALIAIVFASTPMLVPFILGKKLSNAQMDLMRKKANFTSVIKDFFTGFEVIKTFNAEKKINEKFESTAINVEKSRYKSGLQTSKAGILTVTLMTFSQFATMLVAGYLSLTGSITIGAVVALVSLSASVGQPIQFISINLTNIKSTKEIRDNILNISKQENSKVRANKISNTKNIVLNDLSFSYNIEDEESKASKEKNSGVRIMSFDATMPLEEMLKKAGVPEGANIINGSDPNVDLKEILKDIDLEEQIKNKGA